MEKKRHILASNHPPRGQVPCHHNPSTGPHDIHVPVHEPQTGCPETPRHRGQERGGRGGDRDPCQQAPHHNPLLCLDRRRYLLGPIQNNVTPKVLHDEAVLSKDLGGPFCPVGVPGEPLVDRQGLGLSVQESCDAMTPCVLLSLTGDAPPTLWEVMTSCLPDLPLGLSAQPLPVWRPCQCLSPVLDSLREVGLPPTEPQCSRSPCPLSPIWPLPCLERDCPCPCTLSVTLQ